MSEIPTAVLKPKRHNYAIWLLPLLALLVVASLFHLTYQQQGIVIQVQFSQGYGLKAGDGVRYRGITVGEVQKVSLSQALDYIDVDIVLSRSAHALAKEKSQFWIVRPQFDLSGATGLETVIGANYVAVLPGEGRTQKKFLGLDAPPLLALMPEGGLEISLIAKGRGGLNAGAPVLYRQVQIGTVLSVDLAHDASAVEAHLYIMPSYTNLIRDNAKFWHENGLQFEGSITGRFALNVDSLKGLLLGRISLALPPTLGSPVQSGHRFTLHSHPQRAWLEWKPYLSLNNQTKNNQQPQLIALQLQWQYRSIAQLWQAQDAHLRGWGLPVAEGILAPANLLRPPPRHIEESVQLRIANTQFSLRANKAELLSHGIALLRYQHDYPVWHNERWLEQPETIALVAAANAPHRLIEASKIIVKEEQWYIDPRLVFDHHWHGAVALATQDNALVGMLLLTKQGARLVRLPLPEQSTLAQFVPAK